MEVVERQRFEQAIAGKLVQWERMRMELEQSIGKGSFSRDMINDQIEKLQAKYGATISQLREMGFSLSE